MPRTTTRPQTLQGMAGAGALMVGLYTGHVGPHWLEFTRPALPITGLPRELPGRSLWQRLGIRGVIAGLAQIS